MAGFLLFLLVGWPIVLVTVVLTLIGLIRNDHRYLFSAAILAFPFSWFISGLPELHFPAILNLFLPALLYGSSYFMFRGREMIAWLLGIPFFLVILLLLFATLAQ